VKKADVKLSYHTGTRGLPVVNVKLYSLDLVKVAAQHTDEFSDPLFPAWLRENLGDGGMQDSAYQSALEDGWRNLQDEAHEIFGRAYATVYSAGRSGGWAVVKGLPDVETWDAVMVGRWARFAKYARRQAEDVPYLMVWALYHHEFEQYRETIDACVAVHARDAGMVGS
jgi:hypothetical protein